MGLLDFLNKRPPVDTSSGQKTQTTSAQVRGVIASRESGTRTPDPSQRLLKPRLVGISEVRPGTNPKDSSSTKPFQLKAVGRNPKDSISGLKLDAVPKFSDRERPRSRNDVEQLTPRSLNFPRPRRRSSAFVDILDAQGEIKPSNFKSRIQASGTRDYGEDVADRNMVESLPSPRTRAVYSSLSGSTLPYRPHGSVSTASSSRYAFKGQAALEYPRDNSISATGFNGRPSSRHTSIRSRPGSRGGVSPATESFDKVMSFDGNDFHDYRPQSKMSYGQISVTGSRASTPQQAPRTADGSYMRDESNTLYDDLRSASPPGVPRYKPRQYSLPSGKFPSGALPGSVRSARENLNNSLLPPHFDRSRRMYQQRCKTPTSPNQLHSFRHRVDNDWSRFNRHAGDYLHPASSAWENASSSASEYAPSFSFGSTGNLQIDDADRQPSIRTFGRRGSISSYAPSDYSGQQLTSGRSIRTADTSIDVPHNSLFNEIKFLGDSSRNLRSRGGDSYIAPDRTGAEEDSGGESIFISPATPSEEHQPPFSPLSPSHRYGGLSISSYDATSVSDSDADSFCNEQRQTRRDGEALLFRAQGFGDDGKSLPGLFNGPESLSVPKWPEIPATPTDVSEMGDDESSVIGLAVTSPEPRQTFPRPFTQRERLLALGYDYDSDSDIETSVDSDEVPEDRALQLLSALVRGRTSAASGSQSTKGPPADMKAIAKLRKDAKRRQRLDASPAGRRSKSSSGESGEVNTATATK